MDSQSSAREWTTISVHSDIHSRVKSLKRGGETFNELFDRIVEERER